MPARTRILCVAALATITGCVTNPGTGEQEMHPAVTPAVLLLIDIDAAVADDELTDDEIAQIITDARALLEALDAGQEIDGLLAIAEGNVTEVRAAIESGDTQDILRAALRAYVEAQG